MNNRICFIITTFMRDELLYKSVESLLPYIKQNPDWRIVIVDQGKLSTEKEEWLDKNNIDSFNYSRKNNPQQLFYYQVPFDSGLSFCRNYGVKKAKELECDYVYIGSDSFIFHDNIILLNDYVKYNLLDFDLIGNELHPSKCGWEAKLTLIEGKSFELNFIDKSTNDTIFPVEICRNCFIAKTNVLLNTPWDENFRLGEHEDEFYRLKLAGVKCAWSDIIVLTKQTDRPNEYAQLRKTNFDNGIKYLRDKWNIKGWVSYKNLERAKEYYKGEQNE